MDLVTRERFDTIKQKYGIHASWAVWAPPTQGPKSKVGDLTIFDLATSPTTLGILNGGIVMVGLNISRSFLEPVEHFRNFHDPSPKANDFKIRYAFAGTPYYGAYMTDIIKDCALVKSSDLRSRLRAQPTLIHSNLATFRRELSDLPCRRPTILAFGLTAYSLLAEHLRPEEYLTLIRLIHYSHYLGKEQYREAVLEQIRVSEATPPPATQSDDDATRDRQR